MESMKERELIFGRWNQAIWIALKIEENTGKNLTYGKHSELIQGWL